MSDEFKEVMLIVVDYLCIATFPSTFAGVNGINAYGM